MASLYDKLLEKTVRESQQSPAPNAGEKPIEQSRETPLPDKLESTRIEKQMIHIHQQQDHGTMTPTTIPRYHDTNHDTTVPSNHDTVMPENEAEMFEAIRKAVRQVGKEAATQRLTSEEKQTLDDIKYNYKRQGIETTSNEIIRIATNYILQDYRTNGEQSVLAKVLKLLNS